MVRGGRRDVGEPSGEVVPEEDAQRLGAVGRMHYSQNPRADDDRLQNESRVELRPSELGPAPFPCDEREQREPGHQPSRRALGHETHGGASVHQQVAVEFPAAGRRGVAEVGSKERDGTAGEETGVGCQPHRHTECGKGRACHQRGGDCCYDAVHREPESSYRERRDRCVKQVGYARRADAGAQEAHRSGGHPIGERRLLEEGSTGKLRQHPLVLHAHAPGDIGLPSLIWSPSAAIERADELSAREGGGPEESSRGCRWCGAGAWSCDYARAACASFEQPTHAPRGIPSASRTPGSANPVATPAYADLFSGSSGRSGSSACSACSADSSARRARPLPACLDAYIAASARLSSAAGLSSLPADTAMPMLAPTRTAVPCNSSGASSLAMMSSAICSACCAGPTPTSTARNSSPPKRPTRSVRRTAAAITRPT